MQVQGLQQRSPATFERSTNPNPIGITNVAIPWGAQQMHLRVLLLLVLLLVLVLVLVLG